MRAIIIGSNGQDGHYLSILLRSEGLDLISISRYGDCVRGDVADYNFISEQIRKYRPNYVFNFAANSTTRHDVMFENHQTICTGTLNVLEAVRIHCPDAKVFVTGSAMQFRNDQVPIDERTPFEASSPYSVARIQSAYAARYYRDRIGLKVYVGYFFNHDSPLRSERHINQKIVRAAQRIQSGSRERLELGDIDVEKEFNYAGDVVNAVWLMVRQDRIFEAVIGSGRAHPIRQWLEYCFWKIGRNWQDHVVLRCDVNSPYRILVSNPHQIRGMGWKPTVDFSALADLMMESTGN